MRQAWSEVHLDNIRKNVRYLKSCIRPETKFMGVIKADAYGHGVIPVANVLTQEGVTHFAVALVQEGVELRQAGFGQPILLLGRLFEEDYGIAMDYGLIPSVCDLAEAKAINRFAAGKKRKCRVHIKVDTGMGRLGFLTGRDNMEETFSAILEICSMEHLEVDGIYSHLATAPQRSDTNYCKMQFARFCSLMNLLETEGIRIPLRHIANSGATILFPEMQMDMVRPGTAIFGLYAGEEMREVPGYEVYPGMEIKAKLASVKRVPARTKVSYTRSFETKRPSVLSTVPLGYVDGIFRSWANRGAVLLHGQRCPMVGNVCMDQFVIDITEVDSPKVGDEIVIIGRQGDSFISAEEAGALADTISIEVLCGLGKRMPQLIKGIQSEDNRCYLEEKK